MPYLYFIILWYNRYVVKSFKHFLPSLVLIFTLSFMLFIFEPIVLYSGNVNDFWFDFSTMIKPSLIMFVVLVFGLGGVFFCLFLIGRKLKKELIFLIPTVVLFDLFLILYIHGNFLSGALPSLNGEAIDWGGFKVMNIVSVFICLIIIVATVVGVRKLKTEKIFDVVKYATIVIFLMMFVSGITTLFTTDILKSKPLATYATADEINVYSSDKNFLILLVDAVDSKTFSDLLKDESLYKETFRDFSYYPDTVGVYRLTRDSIPFIFSGKWNRNEVDFTTYSTDAYDNSEFFKRLEAEGYERTFYDEDFVWESEKALEFKNIVSHIKAVDNVKFIKQEAKYLLFKYLPFPLKKFSKIEGLDFIATQVEEEKENFNWGDIENYENITDNEIELGNKKRFQFLHLEGAHVPFDLDEDLNEIEGGTYEQKCQATLKIIRAYIERIKEAGIYDNSVIIVMADHGYRWPVNPDPILYIKGINEEHELYVSDKAVWYPDLTESAFDDLLDGKKSSELFKEIGTEGRDRYIIHNPFKEEDHMIEYVQTGKAWDITTLKETGQTFDR